ncbi:xanthine dehydrogenase/oxidase [Biomphalaria pfeifferi]|uniref:Xanthine dehydrogenase/oxidase n=1 Tax=Biomphalaria pfeifferi TaxID=112525 RepID=A0AAD8F816_BIOPF|nr:xanthine dehydrogenase/oxidase [Biomphalaria pfeifferi]
MANWAGNLVMKHSHSEFPSDLFALFETVGAKLSRSVMGPRHSTPLWISFH